MNRAELGHALGVSEKTIQRIEDGTRGRLFMDEVVALARITGQDVSFFGAPPVANGDDGTLSHSGGEVKVA